MTDAERGALELEPCGDYALERDGDGNRRVMIRVSGYYTIPELEFHIATLKAAERKAIQLWGK